MDDGQIVTLYLQRDEAAIRRTAERYGRRLYALALGITADAQTAEECENDTYLQAWNTIPPHEPRGYLYAFLARITRHISLNRCRDRARLCRRAQTEALDAELEQCIPSGERDWEERELAQLLDSFLRGRTEIARLIFLRRYWYGDDIRQMAERFSVGESYIKSSLFRTRKALRQYLEKEGVSL